MPSDKELDRNAGITILSDKFCLYAPPAAKAVELDLGCGSGSYTAEAAKRLKDHHFLAADVMLGRLRKLVCRINGAKLENLTPLRVEARMLVGRMLPDNSLDRLHLLCPDPWPKGKHRGHRLLAADFVAQIHRVLKEEGIFHFSSDDVNYCREVKQVVESSELFAPCPDGIADLAGITSTFERRWLAQGKPVTHLVWKRLPLPPWRGGH